MTADAIKVARKEKGWTQFQLAQKLGYSESRIAKLETGRVLADSFDCKALAKVFDPPPAVADFGDPVRRYLNSEISASKLAELIPEPLDLIGAFAQHIAELEERCVKPALEQRS